MHHKFLEGWYPIPEAVRASGGVLTEHQIRWLIRGKDTNGFDRCVTKVGRAYLINLERMERYLTGDTDPESVDERKTDGRSGDSQHTGSTSAPCVGNDAA